MVKGNYGLFHPHRDIKLSVTCQVVDIKTLKMLSLKVLPIWPGDKQVKIVSCWSINHYIAAMCLENDVAYAEKTRKVFSTGQQHKTSCSNRRKYTSILVAIFYFDSTIMTAKKLFCILPCGMCGLWLSWNILHWIPSQKYHFHISCTTQYLWHPSTL